MRGALLISTVLAITFSSNPGTADPRSPQVEPSTGSVASPAAAGFEKYRGYSFDLSENSERKDVGAIADALRRQLDVVDNSGFRPRVLQFFHRVPLVASEMACLDENAAAACYGLSVPERDHGTRRGVTTWDD